MANDVSENVMKNMPLSLKNKDNDIRNEPKELFKQRASMAWFQHKMTTIYKHNHHWTVAVLQQILYAFSGEHSTWRRQKRILLKATAYFL